MQAKRIRLSKLVVNRANDRHGELPSERDAINWLFEHERPRMRKLANDILAERQVYERPLVMPDAGNFIVFDGNRRVSCLKALRDPDLLYAEPDRSFFRRLQASLPDHGFLWVHCDVENDEETIEKILFRRHNGSQGGVGQTTWSARAKNNFNFRTGTGSKTPVGHAIEGYLEDQGIETLGIKQSILNRLFSNQLFQQRAGFLVQNGKLKTRYSDAAVLRVLQRVISDSSTGKIALNKIWRNSQKEEYLTTLEAEGVLPTASELSDTDAPSPVAKKQIRNPPGDFRTSSDPTQVDAPDPSSRDHLIPANVIVPRMKSDGRRLIAVFHELKNELHVERHKHATSVLFRVLVDLTIDAYERERSLQMYENESLHKRFRKVLKELENADAIAPSTFRQLIKFENSKALFSANTMNDYVHSSEFFPSKSDLISFWDNLEPFFVEAWRACSE